MSLGVDSRYAVQMNRYFLRLIGVWPLTADAHFLVRFLQKVSTVVVYFLMYIVLIPCALHAMLEEPNPVIKVKLIGPISFHVMAVAKYFFLVNGIKESEEYFRHVEEDWTFYKARKASIELSIMQKNAKVGRYLTLSCASFMFGGAFFYNAIMPLSAGRIASSAVHDISVQLKMSNSSDLDIRVPRMFVYPVYERLMKVQENPWYWFVFFLQFLSAFVTCIITVGVCGLAAVYVVHVCSQLEIVMHLLNGYVNESDAGSKGKMKEIVEKHTRALRFAMKVERYLNPLCCVEFVGCTFNIVMLEYYFVAEWEGRFTISTVTYCSLLTSITFNIFIFCYIGEILTEQCKKVGEITYDIDWYKLPGKKALDIKMIMIISSCYPAKITAGKIVYLSMESFSNVIKTSATYLNMLRTLML